MKTEERVELPGGGYAIAYFADKDKVPTSKEKATHVEIHEFSKDGKEVRRTYGTK